jgi:glycosyltransferase involved in cell wall biosynthesis
MNILFLSNVFPNPWQPTRGTFNLEMVQALARRHTVRVVSPLSWVDEWRLRRSGGPPLGPGRRATVGGVEAYYPRFYYTPRVLRGFYDTFLWYSIRPIVRRLLEEARPDVVLGYWVHPDGAVALRVARSVGATGVVMSGGSDVLVLARVPSRRRHIQRVLAEADAVLTASQNLSAKVAALDIDPTKIHVVSRGVDTGRFCPGDRREARRRLGLAADGPVLLWVGRMAPVKGLDVLLAACGGLRDRGLAFRLQLVGDGPLRRPLEAEARARGLSAVVSFVGLVPHDDLPDWYRAADLTVLPSYSEGVPNVLRESLACGTPFVASRVGGIPELAEGTACRLVAPGDPAALTEALAEVLTWPGPAEPVVSRSAGWDESAEALLAVLRPLLARQSQKEGALCQP